LSELNIRLLGRDEMEEEKREWRYFKGEWHLVEIFPEATRYRSLCGIFQSFGLFDKIRKEEDPPEEEVCPKCQCQLLLK